MNITERKYVRFPFTAHRFIYKVGDISTSGILSIKSPSRKVWVSLLLVVRVSIGCLSTQANVTLYRTDSRDLRRKCCRL